MGRGKFFWILMLPLLYLACTHSKKSAVEQMIANDKQYADWRARNSSVDWDDLKKVDEMTKLYLHDYPKSEHAQYISAVMAGDYSELLTPREEKAIKDQSVQTLFKLLETLGRYSAQMQSTLRNEYYYHSGQYLNQYLLGCEGLTQGHEADGWFSIGVGASEHAYELLKRAQLQEARYFASKAAEAWEKHKVISPKWALPYPYFYIQALAISGQMSKANEVLGQTKLGKSYALKKAIYDKYEIRLHEIERAIGGT